MTTEQEKALDHVLRKLTPSERLLLANCAGNEIQIAVRNIDPDDLDHGDFCTCRFCACQCHERDSSYTCDYCKSQGRKGHME